MAIPLNILCGLALLGATTLRAASPPDPATTRPEIIRLADGTLVHGEIIEFDEATGLTLERADTGGILSLRWEHLLSSEVTRIKADRGFTGDAPEPYLINVVHLILKNGTTASGVLVDGDEGYFSLRRRSGTDRFPKNFVRSVERGSMEGRQLFAPDELYRMVLAELGAPEDALAHFNLAVACEGAGLHEPAREHYAQVAALDPDFKPDLIAARQARIQVRVEEAVETAAMDAIRARLYHKQFDQALAMAGSFRAEWPTSRQLGELGTLEAEIRRRKISHHARGIVSDYFSMLEKRIGKIARDRGVDLDVAREAVVDLIHEDILATLGRSYGMTIETVDGLWAARLGGSVRSSSYGTGTFILGKEQALAFGRADTKEDELALDGSEPLEDNPDFADLVEKVKRQRAKAAADRQSAGRSGGRLDDEGMTPEEWWATAASEDRHKWLLSYYAEYGEALQVIESRGRQCRRCDGLGYFELVDEDGQYVRHTCATCKNLKFERLVRFR
jgi:hypothetical protein